MDHKNTGTEIRRLSDCSFADAVEIWNRGFQGYPVDMTMSLDEYLARVQREGLAPELSLLAFYEDQPAGFLLNGISSHAGRRVAWNGGTGVSLEFRRRGIGKALLKASIDLYREQAVALASLEAIIGNETAIALYQHFGYEKVDTLTFLKHEGNLSEHSFRRPGSASYSAQRVAPYAVGQLEFYQALSPWQTHWESLRRVDGEALIVSDAHGAPVGYALFKKKRDEQGTIVDIALHQCVALPGPNAEKVVACALENLYAPMQEACGRSTYNFSKSNTVVHEMLLAAGFTNFIEQVHLVLTFNDMIISSV